NWVEEISLEDLSKVQKLDDSIMKEVNNNNPCYKEINGVYYYKKNPEDTFSNWKLIVPGELKMEVLKYFHDDPLMGGHLSRDKTLAKIQEQFYWKKMTLDVEEWIKSCEPCARR